MRNVLCHGRGLCNLNQTIHLLSLIKAKNTLTYVLLVVLYPQHIIDHLNPYSFYIFLAPVGGIEAAGL